MEGFITMWVELPVCGDLGGPRFPLTPSFDGLKKGKEALCEFCEPPQGITQPWCAPIARGSFGPQDVCLLTSPTPLRIARHAPSPGVVSTLKIFANRGLPSFPANTERPSANSKRRTTPFLMCRRSWNASASVCASPKIARVRYAWRPSKNVKIPIQSAS